MSALDRIATEAWEASRSSKNFSAARWVRSLSQGDLVAVAASWVNQEIERRERAATLRIERDTERRRSARARDAEPEPVPDGTLGLVETATAATTGALDALDAAVTQMIDRHRDNLIIEWTADLLRRSISLPDGTRTTWGEATVEQHAERARMFESYATASIEGAARHRKAIEDLASSGHDTLNELVAEVAA